MRGEGGGGTYEGWEVGCGWWGTGWRLGSGLRGEE